jgi:hypothetical protein
MAQAYFKISYEVTTGVQRGWELLLQWGVYRYRDGKKEQAGYRFIWRGPRGLQSRPARIPSATELFELIEKAKKAGWFEKCERQPNALDV